MSDNAVKLRNEQMPAAPDNRNAFERVGDELMRGNAIIGDLLRFSKGDWLAGMNDEEIEDGRELVAVLPALVHGWVRWAASKPVEHIMGVLADGFVPPARSTLGYSDASGWEAGPSGKVRDPWQTTVYLPMVTLETDAVFTFTCNSDGGKRHAIGPLCKEYGARARQHPDELPIVKLGQDSYAHTDRSIGRVKYPVLPVTRWVKANKYTAAIANAAGQPVKLLEPQGGAQ